MINDWAKILDNKGQVDTFLLDFEKAFDTPPHELLKSKLFSYGIGGKTLKWINAFLCYRQQRVVVNGVKSDWAPVVSGVPQGTVLGPLLFSLHINDITADIESEIRLFADDCVCYREIKDKAILKNIFVCCAPTDPPKPPRPNFFYWLFFFFFFNEMSRFCVGETTLLRCCY